MSDTSFHSVLLRKLEDLYSQSEAPSSSPSPTASSTVSGHPRHHSPSLEEPPFTRFVKHAVFPNTQFIRAYPAPVQKVSAPHPTPPQVPRSAQKNRLNENAQSKWNLFEKTFQKSLGSETTRSAILKAFRSHIKSVHPDLNTQAESYNFAHLVKVKDELVAAVEEHLRTLE